LRQFHRSGEPAPSDIVERGSFHGRAEPIRYRRTNSRHDRPLRVKGLVSTGRLPHASAVRRVWADGAIIVLSTTLTDHAAAEDLYERLSTAAGCDDSYLLVKGYRVVLQDGSQVTAPRRGYQTCAGT
jgi:hypothetical protein